MFPRSWAEPLVSSSRPGGSRPRPRLLSPSLPLVLLEEWSHLDNITHSLIGVALAECAVRSHPDPDRGATLRPAAWLVSVLANNAPDVDTLYSNAMGGTLGHLIHHRGYTHTLVAALPLGLLVLGLAMWFLRRWHFRDPDPAGRWHLLVLAVLGPLLHLWMDSWGSYGGHLLWPWNSRWSFGDRVFILEPWIWVCLLPVLMVAPPMRRRGCWVLLGLYLALLLMGNQIGWIPGSFLLALFLGLLSGWGLASRLDHLAAPLAVGLVFLGVEGLGVLSGTVKTAVRDLLPVPPHDVIVSPLPGDPRSWTVLTVEVEEARDLYRIRRGAWSAGGDGASELMRRIGGRPTAPLVPPDLPSTPALAWSGQFEGKLSELRRLSGENCRLAGFLRFARAPYWKALPEGGWIYGDLRFDRSEGIDFAEFLDPRGPEDDCADLVGVPWGEPIAPILGQP